MKKVHFSRLFIAGISLLVVMALLTACPPVTENPPDDTNNDNNTNTDVKVTSITLSGTGGGDSITMTGGVLQIKAAVLPDNATNKNVTWSISAGSEFATVSDTGLVSPIKNGVATIKATAIDGSTVFGTKDITISGQTGTVRFKVESEATIDDTHPVIVQIASDINFTNITGTLKYTSTQADTELQIVAGTHYFREFHDLDNSTSLSANDLYNILAEYYGDTASSGASPAFVPKIFTLTSGNIEDIRTSLISIPQNWVYPATAGTIKITASYSGALGPVSASKPFRVGVGTAPALDLFSETRIDLQANSKTIYIIVPSGTHYVGGFLNTNNDLDMDKGEPRQIYNNKDLNGSTSGDAIVVTSGNETAITYTIDDTYTGQTGLVQFNVASVTAQAIDATHPFVVEVSPNQNFINTVYSQSYTTAQTEVTFEVPVSTCYFRMFHDLDNNAYLSEGDILYIHNDIRGGGTVNNIVYVPKTIIITDGATVDLTSASLYSDWVYPANAKVLKINASYSGSLGTVSAANKLYLGIDTAKTFDSANTLGIELSSTTQSIFSILPSGTYYVGGFFDEDGNSTGVQETGDPIQVYNGLEFNGTNGSAIDLSLGLLTEISFNLGDTFLAP